MKKVLLGISILLLIYSVTGCAKHVRIRNTEFNKLLEEISNFDSVTKRSSAYWSGGGICANFYVDDSFSKYDEMKIFYLIKECFSADTSERIMLELNLTELPDIEVMMRVSKEKGYFARTYYASIYETSDRTGLPDYDKYVWSLEDYYDRLSTYDEDTLRSIEGGGSVFWRNRARVMEVTSESSIIVAILPMLVQGKEQKTDTRQDSFTLIDGDIVVAVFDIRNTNATEIISRITEGSIVNIYRYAIPIINDCELDCQANPIVADFDRIDTSQYWSTN